MPLQMSTSSKEKHSVYHFLQPRPARMATQWVRELYSLHSLAPGRHAPSLHRQTVVFALLVGTKFSSSTDRRRRSLNGFALEAIQASLETGLTWRDLLNLAYNLWQTTGHFFIFISFFMDKADKTTGFGLYAYYFSFFR